MKLTIKPALSFLFTLFLALGASACGDDGGSPPFGDGDGGGGGTKIEPVGVVTDIDGNEYPYVEIGGRHFTQKNLDVTRYQNGDEIPEVTDPEEWSKLTTGAWCHYENVTSHGTLYGKLYNWHAVNDPRGLAPEGFRVPTLSEWTALSVELGGRGAAGAALKAVGEWPAGNGGATDEVGFRALPSGHRDRDGRFSGVNSNAYFWSSSEYGSDMYNPEATFYSLIYLNATFGSGHNRQTMGMAIRLIEEL